MIKSAMFIGACLAIYAVFSYLEAKLVKKVGMEIAMEYLKENEDEVIPKVIKDVTDNITNIFLVHFDELIKLGLLNVVDGVMNGAAKENIAKAGEENNKKFE